ncbi:hypothetical protein P7D22_16315 [Lichenihabitans sp. Uapishka_5]|uniref:hypothetical protein n=1 Tax=Lichenihabitans sp. Uapishka_5 TaxID=3037302 RepID=UPI0029E7F408|nr:hypothetical protein [Lichenihabitans sp. Uapishka_5]MDX7952733.1 hypothetical protein [Lichenihabitans sp. Uapishka_5]
MANIGRTPGSEEAPIESRRVASGEIDPAQPVGPDDEPAPAPDLPEFGEFAAESARPSPLDDIAEIEREQLPRD